MRNADADGLILTKVDSREVMSKEDMEQVAEMVVRLFLRGFLRKDRDKPMRTDPKNRKEEMKCQNDFSQRQTFRW